jgi:hypothetical protein
MRSPVHALLWEQWRRLRWPMLFALLFMAAASLLDYTLSKTQNYNPRGMLSLVMMSLSMPVFIAFLFFSHSQASDLHLTLPARLYTLPVKTHVLVSSEFFFRLGALGLLSFAMLSTHYLLFRDEIIEDASLVWRVPVLVMVSFAFLQTVSWWPRGPLVLAAVIASMLVTRAWLIVGGGVYRARELPISDKLTLFALVPAFAYLVALVGVRRDRSGTRIDIRTRLAAMLRMWSARSERFSSPAHAQAWFEWKRKGMYVPIVATSCLAITLVIPGLLGWFVPHSPHAHDDYVTLIAMLALGLYPLIAAFTVGMLIPALDHRDMVSGFSSFVMTRPINTKQLAAARLKMGAFSVGLTYILAVVILIARFGLPAFLDTLAFLPDETLRLGIPQGAFVLVACCHVVLAWTLLWLSLPLSGALFAYYAVYVLVVLPNLLPAPTNTSSLWVGSSTLFLAIALLGILACRRRTLTARKVPAVLLVCIISAIVVVATVSCTHWGRSSRILEEHAATAFSVALSLLPVAAFLWEPLKLDWFRHR